MKLSIVNFAILYYFIYNNVCYFDVIDILLFDVVPPIQGGNQGWRDRNKNASRDDHGWRV